MFYLVTKEKVMSVGNVMFNYGSSRISISTRKQKNIKEIFITREMDQ